MKLTELLVTIAILAIVACLLLPALGRAFRTAKLWCWSIAAAHERRIECIDREGDWRELGEPVRKWSVITTP